MHSHTAEPATAYAAPFPAFTVDHRSYAKGAGETKPRWGDQDRSIALWVYAETGSFADAERATGIPSNTVKNWVDSDDDGSVAAEMEELRLAVRSKTAHKVAALADVAVTKLGQALARGDPKVLKNGDVVYVPQTAKDLSWIFSILVDKHALLTGMTSGRATNASIGRLAEQLLDAVAAKVASSQAPSPHAIPPADLG